MGVVTTSRRRIYADVKEWGSFGNVHVWWTEGNLFSGRKTRKLDESLEMESHQNVGWFLVLVNHSFVPNYPLMM